MGVDVRNTSGTSNIFKFSGYLRSFAAENVSIAFVLPEVFTII